MTDLFSESCPECEAVTVDRLHAGYRSGCKGCVARAVARGPDFHRCRTAGKQDRRYRDLLAAVGVTHEAVVKAAEIDKERTPA